MLTVAMSTAVTALLAPLFILGFAALIVCPSVWLAGRRGRSRIMWGGFSIFFPLLSILLLALLGDTPERKQAREGAAATI